ncbi:MAG TPA: multidrug effflux MFS transporter [Dongiaceae bacterium]|nr:multidrug effflux MFS transporter [Dongiaceae bacterium]
MSNHSTRDAIVLGMLTMVSPFAIDMYLPALPEITRLFAANEHAVQASLMSFMVAVGTGQLIAGPLSDMYGRKRPLYAGLVIFLIGSIGCALAPTIGGLIVCRLLQGLGACAIMVIPRAMVRDLHTGPEAARLMSLLMMIYSISPILAPLAGSFVADHTGWRSIFWLLAIIAAAGLVMLRLFLPETRPASARAQSGVKAAFHNYRILLSDPHFLAVAVIASMSLAGFFVYVANSSFVMQTHYGLSPAGYSMLFAINAISFVVTSQMTGHLARRFGFRRLIRTAIIGQACTTLLLLLLILAGIDMLALVVVLLAAIFGFMGFILPSTFVLAMERHASRAGTASALIGTMNFAGGAAAVAAVSPFINGTPLPMVAGITACSIIVLLVGLVMLGRRSEAEAPSTTTERKAA